MSAVVASSSFHSKQQSRDLEAMSEVDGTNETPMPTHPTYDIKAVSRPVRGGTVPLAAAEPDTSHEQLSGSVFTSVQFVKRRV